MDTTTSPVDCACVIVGDAYHWGYVDRLYSMLSRNLSRPVRLHVYTESTRAVPDPYVKHSLIPWKFADLPRRRWWYKMQLFNSGQHAGPLLYMDLDVVIIKNIDWIVESSTEYFWGIRDFKYLWRPTSYSLNSSVMWWDTRSFDSVWQQFVQQPQLTVDQHRGDQDFINTAIAPKKLRLFDQDKVQSWRWQVHDGGLAFPSKKPLSPGSGACVSDTASVLVFHGDPKPETVLDPVVKQHWR